MLEEMVQKQAEIISRLNENIRGFEDKHRREIRELKAEIRMMKPKATFYDDLLEQVQKNEALKIAWDDFVLLLKMVADEDYLADNK